MAKVLQRLTMAAVLIGGLTALAVETADAARPDRPGSRAARPTARRSFNLFAGNPTGELQVNRVYCGMTDAGESCTDVTGSPVLGGGSWPRGTPDQYVFNTGIQVVGVIPANAGFAWAGDTVGAWAIDTRGPATHMVALSGFYSSLIPDDAANWPSAAYVNDPTLYNTALLGRATISQQDTYSRYWDGSTTLLTGRRQTAGILVEQRTLAWNFPTGNEDLVYILYRFTNVTARASSGVYANLAQYGYSSADIAEIAALGDAFQNSSEAAFNIAIPDAGYDLANVYVAFTADMDVGDAGNNYATASMPFSLGITWKSDWLEPAWQYPSSIFSAPFAAAPGFVGVKYLKSPLNPATGHEFGTTIFSTYTNPSAANSPFPDPLNIYQGYRYYQGTAGPATGDQSCQYPPSRRLCYLTQAPSDQRTMQSSGPFTLAPGQSEVVVVAFIFAPPLATNGSFNLGPYIGNTSLVPGVAPLGDRLVAGLDTIRFIDRVMGWVSHTDANGDLEITQDEVTVRTGSLLDKSLVAQAVFDNKFLLPFAPDAPDFYLIPANNQVTVVWQTSATETTGDPYFVVASDPTSALYDPNFRQFDVEGYRIWRGRSSAEMELVIQYDYAGTVIYDYTGAFYNADYNNASGGYQCAPEIGITASCPGFPHAINLADGGPGYAGAVQVPAGGRVALANGNVLITVADTAVVGNRSGFPALTDSDVPFAYLDTDVRNGYRYFYSVTAFDVNSFASGPSSLTSALITKSVTPRAPASTEVVAELSFGVFGDDTVQLNGRQASCTFAIDPNTGRFNGPPCPRGADQLAATFAPLVPQLLPGMTLEFKIDSVRSRTDEDFSCGVSNIQGICAQAFVTFTQGANSQSFAPQLITPIWEGFGGTDALTPTIAMGAFRVDADSLSAARFGIPDGFAGFNASVEASFNRYIRYSAHEGQGGRRILGAGVTANMFSPGGSRWFDGANETMDHPTAGVGAGRVAGVDTIFAPQSHIDADPNVAGNQPLANNVSIQCFPYIMSMWGREADVQVTWGAGGTIASVRDITHNVDVDFKAVPQASWGFIGDNNGNGKLDWWDYDRLEGVWQSNNHLGFCSEPGTDPGAGNRALLSQAPVVLPTSVGSSTTIGGFPTTGNGIGMYILGHRFIFQNTGAWTAPAAGTVWTLRSYAGFVTATNPGSATPSNYRWTDARVSGGATVIGGAPIPPTPMIPGMRVVFTVPNRTEARTLAADDLTRVHTVPDPYYVTNNAEISTNTKVLRFVNMPPQAIVRIYSVSGILVNVLAHNDAGLGGEMTWNLRNRNNQFVASGVYFYHVETPTGQTHVGRFTVVNYAQ